MDGDLTQASDTVLVLAIGRWSEEALAEAFRRHAGAAYAVAMRILSDEGAAKEIAHDAFVRLWHEPDRFDPERGTLRAYLLNFTHSRAIDRLRAERRRKRRELDDVQATSMSVGDIDREVWDLTVASTIRAALGALPEEERRVIECAYFGGYTYRETAALLELPEGTAKSRIRSGLRRLQAKLVEAGVTEVEP